MLKYIFSIKDIYQKLKNKSMKKIDWNYIKKDIGVSMVMLTIIIAALGAVYSLYKMNKDTNDFMSLQAKEKVLEQANFPSDTYAKRDSVLKKGQWHFFLREYGELKEIKEYFSTLDSLVKSKDQERALNIVITLKGKIKKLKLIGEKTREDMISKLKAIEIELYKEK